MAINTVNNPNNSSVGDQTETPTQKTINPSTDLGTYCIKIFDKNKHNMKTFIINNATVQIELVGEQSLVTEIK